MNGVAETATKYSSELPEWFGGVFWNLLAVFLVLSVVMAILRIIRSAVFRESSEGLLSFLGAAIKKFFAGAFSQLESPIERPRTKLVMKALGLVHTYLMAVIFFLFFAGVVVAILTVGMPSEVSKFLGILGFLTFFFYMMVLFRAEADREYLAFKEYWRDHRNKDE